MTTGEADDSLLKRRARRRLIGAIALVLLAVIVLPMVFDAEKRPLEADISIQIPNQDAVVARSINAAPGAKDAAPVAPEAVKGAEVKAESKAEPKLETTSEAKAEPKSQPKPETKSEPRAEPKPEAKPETKAEPKPAAKADDKRSAKDLAEEKRAAAILNADAATAKAASTSGGFAVQVGAFATGDKVQEARDKLTAAGVKTYIEKLDTKDGERTRVRAGPYAERDAADGARDKIRGLGFGGAQTVAR